MTTLVEFHTGVADALGFACRLLRKAYRQGARVSVIAEPAMLRSLDRALWTFEEREFVPHLRVSGETRPASLAQRTPIWLLDEVPAQGAPPVLVNLGAELPSSVADFERIIEIVSTEPDEAERGRTRWRQYRARGLTVKHHGPGESA